MAVDVTERVRASHDLRQSSAELIERSRELMLNSAMLISKARERAGSLEFRPDSVDRAG